MTKSLVNGVIILSLTRIAIAHISIIHRLKYNRVTKHRFSKTLAHQKGVCYLAPLTERGVVLFELFEGHSICSHRSFSLLHPINVVNEVLCAIWPDVRTSSILFAVFPGTLETLSIRVVKNARAIALIILKITLIGLSIRPQVCALAVLFAHVKVSEVHAAIWILEQPLAVHGIIYERPLVNFTS